MRSKCRCSMCPAIHINSRSWLRSSSTHEPSDPPPKVVFFRFKAVARPAPPTQEACEVEPVASNPKIKRLRIQKQKKARGRHPSTRPTGLFKPSPTDGRPLLKRKRELPSPLPRRRQRESGPPFPSASLAETADGSLTLARQESPTSRASQVPHSHSFSGGGPTAKAQAGPNFEDVHPSKAIIVHARL